MVSYAPAPDPHSICKGWIGFPKKESRLWIVGYNRTAFENVFYSLYFDCTHNQYSVITFFFQEHFLICRDRTGASFL